MGPMPRQRYPYFVNSGFGSWWAFPDPWKTRWHSSAIAVLLFGLSVSCATFVTERYVVTHHEYPTEEVRRSFEFPEQLRNKYKSIFGELDHAGKYVDPSEFYDNYDKLAANAGDHGHH